MQNKHEQEALFWCSLLSPLIFDKLEHGEKTKFLQELAAQDHVLPDGRRKRVSVSTLKRILKKYREQGFDGVQRKRRCDRGQIRVVSQDILEKAIEIKKDQPLRGEQQINDLLEEQFDVRIKRSTLHRHLRQAGATKA